MAWDELSGMVVPDVNTDYQRLRREVASFDWPSVFTPGSVIRSRDGRRVGVVVDLLDHGDEQGPRYDLLVDSSSDGELAGILVWEPWNAVLSNDASSRAEAQRLGLLHGGEPPDE